MKTPINTDIVLLDDSLVAFYIERLLNTIANS